VAVRRKSVFEVQRYCNPSGLLIAKGRKARGAAERGHEQDAPSFNARQGARRGWRLAHGSALEALGELGRRSTVMRGVL